MIERNLIEGVGEDSQLKALQSAVAHSLLARLTTDCRAYCILSGYDQLPEAFDTDIDFMVGTKDLSHVPEIVQAIGRETGTKLFQFVEHEISARAFLLVQLSGSDLNLIQPDSTADYRHFGLLWLRADEVLAARRLHPRGFWIPAAAHEFIYYLVKRLNKRDFTAEHGHKLHRLYLEDPNKCDALLARFWSGKQREALRAMAASGDWTPLLANLKPFRRELRQQRGESFLQAALSSGTRAHHFLTRIFQPTGAWIGFMGPDGCGKSSVIDEISRKFAPVYRGVDRYHLQPKLLVKSGSKAPATDPHGTPPRGLLASVAKVFYMMTEYYLGYFKLIRPAMIRTRLVIFDRFIYDLLVDSKRVRYGGPPWLLKLAARIVPRPGLMILLDAPPEVLYSRKQEVPFEEVVRQRTGYLEMARKLPSAVVIDASQPLPDVLHDVADAIISYLEHRTAKRLRLRA